MTGLDAVDDEAAESRFKREGFLVCCDAFDPATVGSASTAIEEMAFGVHDLFAKAIRAPRPGGQVVSARFYGANLCSCRSFSTRSVGGLWILQGLVNG